MRKRYFDLQLFTDGGDGGSGTGGTGAGLAGNGNGSQANRKKGSQHNNGSFSS